MEREQQEELPPSILAPERRRQLLIMVLVVSAIIVIGRVSPFSPVRDGLGVFSWVTEQGVDLARELFERWGYQTVFFAPMAENTLFIGALIPGTLVMLLAGLSAHDELINIWIAVPLAAAGAIIGDTISYWMGRLGVARLGSEARLVKFADRMRDPLLRNDIWLILSYHFAGYSRLIGPAAAGFLRMPFRRWMLLDYVGVTLWVIVFLSAGYLLGVAGLSLETSDRNVQIFEVFLFIFFVIAIVTILNRASKSGLRFGHKPAERERMEAASSER